jgi:hypothetical protein
VYSNKNRISFEMGEYLLLPVRMHLSPTIESSEKKTEKKNAAAVQKC